MGKVVKFFGILIIGIALTLVIFGHVTMVMIYSMDYLMETIFPTDPKTISSLWFVVGSIFPGGLIFLLGTMLERMGKSQAAIDDDEAIKAARAAGTIIGAKPEPVKAIVDKDDKDDKQVEQAPEQAQDQKA